MSFEDEKFGRFQDRRSQAERELKEIIGGWSFANATDDMTFQQIRDLTDKVVVCMNKATRDSYALGEERDEEILPG